jgi:hypothetical protein
LQQFSGIAVSFMQSCSSFPALPEVLCKVATAFRHCRKFHAKLQQFTVLENFIKQELNQ